MDNSFNDILDDFSDEEFKYELADKGLRFVNYFVDRIISQVLTYIPALGLGSSIDLDEAGGLILFYLLALAIPFFYYVLCEYYLDGRTLAKFITKTKVVKEDGSKPSFVNLMGRTLARFIPFEPFSFFGALPKGWHDTLSKTIVIKE